MRHAPLFLLLLALTLGSPLAVSAAPPASSSPTPSPAAALSLLPLHRGALTPDTPLRTRSGLTRWGLEPWLAHRHPALRGTAAAFLAAERAHRVNARALLSIAGGESGWGTSWIARHKRNLFGFGALHRDPARYAVSFPTLAAGIDHVAAFISRHYLRPGGKYANGPTLAGMMRKWAPAGSWARMVARVSRGISPADPLRDLAWGEPETRLLLDADGGSSLETIAAVAPERRSLPDPASLTLCLRLVDADGLVTRQCVSGEALEGGVRWVIPLAAPFGSPRRFRLELADLGGEPLVGQPEAFGAGIVGRLEPYAPAFAEAPLLYIGAPLPPGETPSAWRLVLVRDDADGAQAPVAAPPLSLARPWAVAWRGTGLFID